MDTDAELMRRALALAATARRRTPPNPWVGCLLVRDGEVVGEGATQPPGWSARRGRGAPSRRGPGTRRHRLRDARALLAPRAARLRAPTRSSTRAWPGSSSPSQDPDPNVSGAGHRRAARTRRHRRRRGGSRGGRSRLLAPYLVHRVLGRSFVVLKTATSLDGRIAARDGSSRWITGPAARADVARAARRLAGGDRRSRDRARRPAEPHRARHVRARRTPAAARRARRAGPRPSRWARCSTPRSRRRS